MKRFLAGNKILSGSSAGGGQPGSFILEENHQLLAFQKMRADWGAYDSADRAGPQSVKGFYYHAVSPALRKKYKGEGLFFHLVHGIIN